jgi:hypothetical protein
MFLLVTSFKSANESTILYPGLDTLFRQLTPPPPPPLAALPISSLDASSSVIYNLYGANRLAWQLAHAASFSRVRIVFMNI